MSKNREIQEKETEKRMVLKMSDIDPKFKYEISKLPGAETILLCFQCGTCTADCPIARFSDFYRPRKLIRMIQLGLKDTLLSNDVIWLCSTCFTCVVYKELASNILKTGYAYMIPRLRLKKRDEEGLPSLPKADLENLVKLFDLTGLSKTLERLGT